MISASFEPRQTLRSARTQAQWPLLEGVESVVEALALMGGDLPLATLLKCLKRKKLSLPRLMRSHSLHP